jgi:hypothetical protein
MSRVPVSFVITTANNVQLNSGLIYTFDEVQVRKMFSSDYIRLYLMSSSWRMLTVSK